MNKDLRSKCHEALIMHSKTVGVNEEIHNYTCSECGELCTVIELKPDDWRLQRPMTILDGMQRVRIEVLIRKLLKEESKRFGDRYFYNRLKEVVDNCYDEDSKTYDYDAGMEAILNLIKYR